jgi:hypothetical protein
MQDFRKNVRKITWLASPHVPEVSPQRVSRLRQFAQEALNTCQTVAYLLMQNQPNTEPWRR